MNSITITNLTKKYGNLTAVDNLNLQIEKGELFALLGTNGAGKTTTIKMLSCLMPPPTSGDAMLLDNSISKHSQEVKQTINLSPQETAVAANLSVLENLEFIAGIYGESRSVSRQSAKEIASRFNLDSVLSQKAKTLSGGMQRRLSIAMALITAPQILFLDEPTLGLDVIARRELWASIKALKGKVTIILTSHYLDEVESLADRIGIMKTFLFANRNTKEVLRDPINLFFGLGFPLILLVLLSVINNSIPPQAGNMMFAIENLTPGLAMFGTVFMALFAGMLLSKDRGSSFLIRLFASPMKSNNFILGYTLPMLIVSAIQIVITILASAPFGFELSINVFPAIIVATLNSLLFVGLGLLLGSVLNEKAVGGVCGALLTNLAGWFSGIFMPLDLIGGAFKTAADIMPFYHSVESIKATLAGNFGDAMPHIAVVLGYTVVIYLLAILIFRRKMNGE